MTTLNATTSFAAYDGAGVIADTDTNIPAQQLFDEAGALFTVEKRQLTYPKLLPAGLGWDNAPSGAFGVVRTDSQALLGVVSKQYELVQNQQLLRMAEFIREEVQMDAVTLMSDGARVAFTAYLNGAEADVVPGDTLRRRIVGYLGHDGKTGCGAMFTSVRVVCSNTLAIARSRATNAVSITHKNGANAEFDKLIQSIDCARQDFTNEVQLFQQFAETPVDTDTFRHFLEQVYAPQLKKPVVDGGIERDRELDDLRIYPKLQRAYLGGMGRDFAPRSLWNAVNAVTEIETSTKYRESAEAQRQFQRANFGAGLQMSKRAIEVAEEMLATV